MGWGGQPVGRGAAVLAGGQVYGAEGLCRGEGREGQKQEEREGVARAAGGAAAEPYIVPQDAGARGAGGGEAAGSWWVGRDGAGWAAVFGFTRLDCYCFVF